MWSAQTSSESPVFMERGVATFSNRWHLQPDWVDYSVIQKGKLILSPMMATTTLLQLSMGSVCLPTHARYGPREKPLRVFWRSSVISRNKAANLSLWSTLIVALSSPKPWIIWTKKSRRCSFSAVHSKIKWFDQKYTCSYHRSDQIMS